jgi:hypothetical protein
LSSLWEKVFEIKVDGDKRKKTNIPFVSRERRGEIPERRRGSTFYSSLEEFKINKRDGVIDCAKKS